MTNCDLDKIISAIKDAYSDDQRISFRELLKILLLVVAALGSFFNIVSCVFN